MTAKALKKLIEHQQLFGLGGRCAGGSARRRAQCRERSRKGCQPSSDRTARFQFTATSATWRSWRSISATCSNRASMTRRTATIWSALAKLHCAIEAAPRRRWARSGNQPPDQRRRTGTRATTTRRDFVDRGRMLHELRGAFRPLVMGEPEAVQKLASLAHQIENRSAPSAKWLRDARAVRDMLPEQAWLDQLQRINAVSSPSSGIFGMPGEAYLRAVIYLVRHAARRGCRPCPHRLCAQAMLRDASRASESVRRSSATPASGRWPNCLTAPGCPISRGFSRG